MGPIVPYEAVLAVFNNPEHFQSLPITRVMKGVGGDPFVTDNQNFPQDPYPLENFNANAMFFTTSIFVTQPREASLFAEEVRALAALPLQTLTVNMAPGRLGERQNLGAIYNTSSYDTQRRYLPTSIMHSWMMCRADQWGPLPNTTINLLSLTDYAQIKVLREYTPMLNMPIADFEFFQSCSPYYFNSAKLRQAAAKLSPNNAAFAQELYNSYLYLATCSTQTARANVVLVDVHLEADYAIGFNIIVNEHNMSQDNFFTLMTSQHLEEDMILSLALWPTTDPLRDYISNTGTYPNLIARRELTIPHYNAFDHLCNLMDNIQKPIPNIIWNNIYGIGAFRTKLFYYINHFMRAYTINSLGMPFPFHKFNHTPGVYTTPTTICQPFCHSKVLAALRWRFQPWELLIALGGTLATKIKLTVVPNSPASDETDAPISVFHSPIGSRVGPTTFKDPLILPPATTYAGGLVNINYHSIINGITQLTPVHHEESYPVYIVDRRGAGFVASNYTLQGVQSALSITNFRKKTTIHNEPYQNAYLELGPL